MTSQHNTTRIVTEWMCEKKNLNLVRSLSNTYQEYSVTKRKKVDSEGFFQVAFLLSPAFLGEINSGTNLTATVSQVQVKGIHCSSSSSFQWSACLFGAKELDLNAEDSYSFFPTGWTTDKTLIQKVIGMQSILEAKDKIVSCQSSCTAEILGDPILGSTTKRIPVLSIVGKSISLKTDLILKESLATLSHSQDKDNWIRNSQYVVAGILVVEGICLKKVLVEMEFGMNFEWQGVQENVSVVTSTETNQISSQDDLVILPSTGLVQKQFLNTLNDLEERGYAMYQEDEMITTIEIKNTSSEQKEFDLFLVSFESEKDITSSQVFPNGIVPSTQVMTVSKNWYEQSIYAQKKTKGRGQIIQHNLFQLNPNQKISLTENVNQSHMKLSGNGYKVERVETSESDFIAQQMRLKLSIPSKDAVSEESTDPWMFSLESSFVLVPKEGTTLDELEITTSPSTILNFLPYFSQDNDFPIGKEGVFKSTITFDMKLAVTSYKKFFIIPSLLIERTKMNLFPRGTTWRMTGMDLEFQFTNNSEKKIRIDIGVYPTDSESFESTSQDKLYSHPQSAPGMWFPPSGTSFLWKDSFYPKHGFSLDEIGIESMILEKETSTKTLISGFTNARNLFLIKEGQSCQEFDFTVSQTPESLEGLFSIPEQDSSFESIAPFVMALNFIVYSSELGSQIVLNSVMKVNSSLVRIS